MKGPRELKRYVSKWRKELIKGHWDDLLLFKLQDTCKKWYKRRKRISTEEMEQ